MAIVEFKDVTPAFYGEELRQDLVVVTHNQNIAKMQTWSFVLKTAKL